MLKFKEIDTTKSMFDREQRSLPPRGRLMALKRAVWFRRWTGVHLRLLSAGGLLGQKNSLDVGQNTSLSNGDTAEEFVQFLVVADGQLEMTGDDPGLLVVTGGVASQLEDFSSQVLQHCGQVHGGACSDPLCVVALAKESVYTSHGELKSGPR